MLDIDGQEFEIFCNINLEYEDTSFDHEFGTEICHQWNIYLEDFETDAVDPLTQEAISIEAEGLETWLIEQVQKQKRELEQYAEDYQPEY